MNILEKSVDDMVQPPPLVHRLARLITEEIPSARMHVFLLGPDLQVVFQNTWPEGEDTPLFPAGIIKRVLKEKHPLIIGDVDSRCSIGERDVSASGISDSKSVLCLPLFIEDTPVGAISLTRDPGEPSFSRQDIELLTALSKPIPLVFDRDFGSILMREKENSGSEDFFIGQSKAIRRIRTMIERVKDADTPVFIMGESGTGKELVARAIHLEGVRKKGEFVAINCGAIPDHLLESELFGFSRGAFTGAFRDRAGLIETADKGTFFLDEVGDLSPPLQAKLLRLLQEKEVRRIGENRTRRVDVRFISATNKDLEREVDCGSFRRDLYYRLRIVTIDIPPLRERREDILLLLNHFAEKYCREMKRERVFFSPRALELLLSYPWPGNVREIQNEIQHCLIIAGQESVIKEDYLSPRINPRKETFSRSSFNYFAAKAEFERRFLKQALMRFHYNQSRTAEEIGLTRQGLFKLIKKHNIDLSLGACREETEEDAEKH